MADPLHVFSEAVRFVMENWPALKLAVEQGFGGAESLDKANWLIEAVIQIFHENGLYSLELQ